MELGLIRKVDIDSEMQQSYLDYAMSVIVARALPDARDGLKPVQRRVLYAMYDMGLRADSTYKKSARIVGEVLGKYHPHGDVAVYESMARLAQDFTMRYGLVAGQGNFGSVDGDPPAAMRYTEARLSAFAMEMLSQIERDTVDFTANFDGTLSEPVVLPAAAPNLLVNGASGIAVGMATSIPPHNLTEVIDALVLMLHEWDRLDELAISDLMKFIQGPDFPTGGIILQENGQDVLLQAYASGRGRVKVRGRVQKEDMERGKSRLIISELPYQVNKSSLIERIADLVRDNVIEGIADLRDESDRQGMRIVIELKAGIEVEPVLLKLYHRTPLESTIGISLLALVDGEPRLLSLKQALRVYLGHRLEVIQRRSEFDLARARARAHILEGLRVALANLDEIIALIKASPDAEQARTRLIKRFKLTELQAQAILDMQLRRLASLERKKIELEYKDLTAQIKELVALLKSPEKMRRAVEVELLEIKEKYGDKRRTRIVALKEGESAKELLTTKDMTPALPVWIGIMEDGTIGRAHEDALPRVSGRAAPRWLLRATTHHTLYLASEDGHAAAVAVEAIPNVENFSEGVPLNKVSPLEQDDTLAAAITLPPHTEIEGEAYIMTVSRMGMTKKSAIAELPGPSTQRFVLARINSGDTLGWAFLTDGKAEVLLVTAFGMAIRFAEADVRPMGLVAAGVNGMKLMADDRVIGADQLDKGLEVLTIADNGKGWRLSASEFPVQGRYGQGVQLCKLEPGSQLAGILVGKRTQTGMIHYKQAAAKSVRVDAIRLVKRQRVGQDLSPIKPGDAVVDITSILDGLSFWEKSASTKRTRSAKSEPQIEEILAVATQEETQVQAALPGLDARSPAGSKPVVKKSLTRAKASPSKDGKGTRSGRTTATKPSARSQQKDLPASEPPLLQPDLTGETEATEKASARRSAKSTPAAAGPKKAAVSQAKSEQKPDTQRATRRSRTKTETPQATAGEPVKPRMRSKKSTTREQTLPAQPELTATPEKSTSTPRQRRSRSTKTEASAQSTATASTRRAKKASPPPEEAKPTTTTAVRRLRAAAKPVEQETTTPPPKGATRAKQTSGGSAAEKSAETPGQGVKEPARTRSAPSQADKPAGSKTTPRSKAAPKGKVQEAGKSEGESGQGNRQRRTKTPAEKPGPPEVHGWEQVDIPPVIQPEKPGKPAKRRSRKK